MLSRAGERGFWCSEEDNGLNDIIWMNVFDTPVLNLAEHVNTTKPAHFAYAN